MTIATIAAGAPAAARRRGAALGVGQRRARVRDPNCGGSRQADGRGARASARGDGARRRSPTCVPAGAIVGACCRRARARDYDALTACVRARAISAEADAARRDARAHLVGARERQRRCDDDTTALSSQVLATPDARRCARARARRRARPSAIADAPRAPRRAPRARSLTTGSAKPCLCDRRAGARARRGRPRRRRRLCGLKLPSRSAGDRARDALRFELLDYHGGVDVRARALRCPVPRVLRTTHAVGSRALTPTATPASAAAIIITCAADAASARRTRARSCADA